ncbi:WXG100 family type VII secretion target [Microbacterium sp. P06]|uniref:WXG100 family type VII secretion target n=1 Tax=unclassified Microbacterium TaxID=2609290 RepID=UPI0037463392
MSDLRVTPTALHAAADRLRSESSRIENALRGLEQEANRLRGNWDGAARVAYDNAHAQWTFALDQMNAVLARIAGATDQIADDYVTADRRSAKLFSGG